MFFQLNRASEHEKKLEELAEEERRKRRLAAEVQQEDREWEEALEEYKDFIRPGELDGLLKLPGQKWNHQIAKTQNAKKYKLWLIRFCISK